MSDFRKTTPCRREIVPECRTCNDYRDLLRNDFHCRCGYCGDHDFFRDTFFDVDHFVPKKHLVNISLNDYTNLVYSCRTCNNSKRAKWPTKDEKKHNDGVQGFIDPCNPGYAKQFERLEDGSILSKTVLGTWMFSALNLGNPRHRLIWKLEQIKTLLDELDKQETQSVEEYQLKDKLNSLYLSFEEQLRGKPNFN